jgi:hypothetical protein
MSQQDLINTLMGVIGAGGGWWINTIWGMVKMQQKEISTLHIKLAENYVPRVEIEAKLARILDTLDEIRDHHRSTAKR